MPIGVLVVPITVLLYPPKRQLAYNKPMKCRRCYKQRKQMYWWPVDNRYTRIWVPLCAAHVLDEMVAEGGLFQVDFDKDTDRGPA